MEIVKVMISGFLMAAWNHAMYVRCQHIMKFQPYWLMLLCQIAMILPEVCAWLQMRSLNLGQVMRKEATPFMLESSCAMSRPRFVAPRMPAVSCIVMWPLAPELVGVAMASIHLDDIEVPCFACFRQPSGLCTSD